MRQSKGRRWFRIHSFTGIVTGLMLFVISWSGTFATVSNEIDWLVTPDLRLEQSVDSLNWRAAMRYLRSAYPDADTLLEAPLYPRSVARAQVYTEEYGLRQIDIHPGTGEILRERDYYSVQRFFRSFHMSLFFTLPVNVGRYVVSIFSLSLVMSLIAALFFYRRWWTRFFRFKRSTGRVFWSEVHKVMGLWSLWFVLIMGATGVWYLFEIGRLDFGDGKVAYVGASGSAIHQIPRPDVTMKQPEMPLDSLVDKAMQLRPDLEAQTMGISRGVLYIDGQADQFLVRDSANQIYLNAQNGDVLYNLSGSDLPMYWRWSDTADPLHFGDFGGLTSKLIWFFFGLALSGLVLSGTYLHVQRLARDLGGQAKARWPGTMAACVVSMIVILASVPFGFLEALLFYGPTLEGTKHLPTPPFGASAVIVSWIIITLAIIALWIFAFWRPETIIRRTEVAEKLHKPVSGRRISRGTVSE